MTTYDAVAESLVLEESEIWRRRGSVDEAELKHFLAGVCEALYPLHERGQVHGGIAPSQIRVNAEGEAHLADERLVLPDALGSAPLYTRQNSGDGPLFGVLQDGYAAFEQYMDEAAWPVGSWTDVHGLSAVAYALIMGDPPPDAVKRMANQLEIRFDDDARQRFSAKLLAAIQRGLSIDAHARQQSVDEFLLSLGVMPGVSVSPPLSPAIAALHRDSSHEEEGSTQGEDFSSRGENTLSYKEHSAAHEANGPAQEQSRKRAPNHERRGSQGKPVGWGLPLTVLLLLGTGAAIWSFQGSGETDPAVAAAEYRPLGQPSQIGAAPDPAQANLASDEAASGQEAATDTAFVATGEPDEAGGLDFSQSAGHGSDTSGVEELELQAEAFDARIASVNQGAAGNEARQEEPEAAGQAPQAQAPEAPKREAEVAAVPVRIDVRPWGEVFIDGVSRGVSPPLRTLALPPGNYELSIRNGDLPPVQSRLTIRAGEPARIEHAF